MQAKHVLSVSALVLAMAIFGGAPGIGQASAVSAVDAQEADYMATVDALVAHAKTLPADASSYAPYEQPSDVLREQLNAMGIMTEVTPPEAMTLEEAIFQLAVARGDDTSVLAGWEAPALDETVESALVRVIRTATIIESKMIKAHASFAPEDVVAVQAHIDAVANAYAAKDVAAMVALGEAGYPLTPAMQDAFVAMAPHGLALVEATEDLEAALLGAFEGQEDGPAAFVDPTGNVEIADSTNNAHTTTRTVLVDVGGDDTYRGDHACGSTFFTATTLPDGTPVPRAAAAYVDLDGDDTWTTSGCGSGAGFSGAGVLIDVAGNDKHSGAQVAQGASVAGIGAMADRDGDDETSGGVATMGASYGGAAVLTDAAGDDTRLAIWASMGFGTAYIDTPTGAGALIDGAGNDLGISIGSSMGYGSEGGKGLMVDVEGDDTYALLDASGFGTRGQGAGVSGGQGIMANGAGNDAYYILSAGGGFASAQGQGYGAGEGVGAFLDGSGSDISIVDAFSASAARNSLATAGGQGLGEAGGVGAYVDNSNPTPQAEPSDDGAGGFFGDQRSITTFSASFGYPGATSNAGDATADSAGQGAGRGLGSGVMVSGIGSDGNTISADAQTYAIATDADFRVSADFDFASDLCSRLVIDYGDSWGYADAYAYCTGAAYAFSFASESASADASASAGTASATVSGQGFGDQNGVGVLADAGGNDLYDMRALALPVAYALAQALAITFTQSVALATSLATSYAISYEVDQFTQEDWWDGSVSGSASSYSRAYSSALAYTMSQAASNSRASATGTATVGDGVSTARGQGAGALNGLGALVDTSGSNLFLLVADSEPIGIAAAFADAYAQATAVAASIAQAGASAQTVQVVIAQDLDSGVDTDYRSCYRSDYDSWGYAYATCYASAFASEAQVAVASAFAAADSDADSYATAYAVAVAVAEASAAGSAAIAVGDAPATAHGQGFGTGNGAGLLVRGAAHKDVTAPDLPEAAPPEAGNATDAVQSVASTPGGDVTVLVAESSSDIVGVAGTSAFADAFANAEAFATGISMGYSAAQAIAQGVAQSTAFADAYSSAYAYSYDYDSWGYAYAQAYAAAVAYAYAQAYAASQATGQAVAEAFANTQSYSQALAAQYESASAASAVSASIGSLSGSALGQGFGSVNGVGANIGGMDDDLNLVLASARANGVLQGSADANGACATAVSLSLGGAEAVAEGQAFGRTNGAGASADAGGDDTYVLAAGAADNIATVASSGGNCGAASGAVARAVGPISSSTGGQAAGSNLANTAFVDLDGTDTYSQGGRGDNMVDVGGSGTTTNHVFVDTAGGMDIVAGAMATACSTIPTGCTPPAPPAPPAVPSLPVP